MKMIQIQVHLEEQKLDRFLYDGCGDTILIIFMVTVAALLALGIITKMTSLCYLLHGIKGWYDGGSITLAKHEYKSSLNIPLPFLLARFFTGYTEDDEGKVEFITSKTSVKDAMDGVIKIFTIVVAIVYVAVLEGLPLVASILNEKNDIRQSACEMMGSATTICCDKTGTLTLKLVGYFSFLAYICGNKNDPPNDTSALPPKIVSLLVESVAHNTTDSVFSPEGGRDVELGMNFDVVRSECSVIYASPFNSEKKRGGVAVKRIIVWKQSLYLLLSENSLCFMYVVIWIRKICFSILTHVNKITIKCDLF
uniref:Cation-transporting P-type ATPase C-terminal domain-containing protein n=1 Tax=Lactuca sativa TaxID=4236 RepID=A0A9R1V0K6_LACSA|nr:hypothetical protein LSAT_V11C700360550 [Lactuca sativa]